MRIKTILIETSVKNKVTVSFLPAFTGSNYFVHAKIFVALIHEHLVSHGNKLQTHHATSNEYLRGKRWNGVTTGKTEHTELARWHNTWGRILSKFSWTIVIHSGWNTAAVHSYRAYQILGTFTTRAHLELRFLYFKKKQRKNSLAEHFQTKVTFRLICSEELPFILYLTP